MASSDRYRMQSGDQPMPPRKDPSHKRDENNRPNACFMIVNAEGVLVPVKPHKVWTVWSGSGSLVGLPVDPDADLTLVTIMRRGLQPVCAWAMRLPTRHKRLDRTGVNAACRDAIDLLPANLKNKSKQAKNRAKDKISWHKEYLPEDAARQIAVYCDSPAAFFREIDIGGPLPLSLRCRMSIEECIEHLLDERD